VAVIAAARLRGQMATTEEVLLMNGIHEAR
jgi:hypothetical protein